MHFQKKPGSSFPRQQRPKRNEPDMGAVVLSTPSSFLPPSSGLLEGDCVSPVSSFVLLFDFPSSISVFAFCTLFFFWLDFALHISFVLFSSLSFSLSLPLPHLSPPSFTSQWWPLAKAVPELSVKEHSNFYKPHYSPKHHFYPRPWAPSHLQLKPLSTKPSSHAAPLHKTSATCCHSCKSRD